MLSASTDRLVAEGRVGGSTGWRKEKQLIHRISPASLKRDLDRIGMFATARPRGICHLNRHPRKRCALAHIPRGIAAALNEHGVSSTRGGTWTAVQVGCRGRSNFPSVAG